MTKTGIAFALGMFAGFLATTLKGLPGLAIAVLFTILALIVIGRLRE